MLFRRLLVSSVFLALSQWSPLHAINEEQAIANNDTRISAIWDNSEGCMLRTVLRDVLRGYGLHAVVIFRPEDSFLWNVRLGSLKVKDVSPNRFFQEIVRQFPGYNYTSDPETGCWFLFPDDGRGLPFEKEIEFPCQNPVTLRTGISLWMNSVSNAWCLPSKNEKVDYSYEKDFIFGDHREAYCDSTTSTWTIATNQNVLWKGLARLLSRESNSYMFVYSTTNVWHSIVDEQSRDEDPTSKLDERIRRARRVKIGVGYKAGETGTNFYWTVFKGIDCSSLEDPKIVALYSGGWSSEIEPQLQRMTDARLIRLYEMMRFQERKSLAYLLRECRCRTYDDVAIRINLDLVRDVKYGCFALDVLLRNASYSHEMQELITSIIAAQDEAWRGVQVSTIWSAPVGINSDVRLRWREMVEKGHEIEMRKNAERDARRFMEERGISNTDTNFYTSNILWGVAISRKVWMMPDVVSAREEAAKVMDARIQEDLRFLGINTNRSFGWVWAAAGLVSPTNELDVLRDRNAHTK